jgi:TIR domain
MTVTFGEQKRERTSKAIRTSKAATSRMLAAQGVAAPACDGRHCVARYYAIIKYNVKETVSFALFVFRRRDIDMTGGVFISYRREDSGGFAGRIYDRLASRLGRENVFFDVDAIPPGRDFVDVLSERVGKCDALLAVIGKHWVLSADSENRRRLDDPQDFVRIEIEAALSRNVPVIPVLVDGATMPHPDDLPDSLMKLIRRQAVEVSHARFESDAERLTQALSQIEEEIRQREADPSPMTPVPAAAAVVSRAPGASESASLAKLGGRRSLVYLAVLGLIVAGAAGLVFGLPGFRKPDNTAEVSRAASPTTTTVDAPEDASARTNLSAVQGNRLDQREIGLIKAAAASICDTVKDIKGQNTDILVKGTVMSQLGGLLGKMADAGSIATGSMGHDEFEGLTRDATTIASAGDRECRMQLFPKMVEALSATPSAVNINSGNCSIAVNGSAAGNSISCGAPSGAKQ